MASVLRQLAASTSQRGDTRHANTLTIRARLSLAFGLILLVTVVIAGTYLNALSALCALAKHVEDRSAI